MRTQRRGSPPGNDAGRTTGPANAEVEAPPTTTAHDNRDPRHPHPDTLSSRTVDWWSVHTYVQPVLTEVGSWPMAGTIAWQLLSDTDPRRWAALLDAARHHVLRVDAAQEALAEASSDIAAAADWPHIGRNVLRGNDVYIPRRGGDDA